MAEIDSAVAFKESFEGREVLVLHDGLKNLNHIRLKEALQTLGFPLELFQQLIKLEHPDLSTIQWEGDYPEKDPVEHIVVRTAQTPQGEVEVTDTTPFKPHTLKSRLTQKDSIGFEAILVQEGKIAYDIPREFNPHAPGVYVASGDRIRLNLRKGDLAIIPSPVARQVAQVDDGSQYRYLGDPWDLAHPPTEIY